MIGQLKSRNNLGSSPCFFHSRELRRTSKAQDIRVSDTYQKHEKLLYKHLACTPQNRVLQCCPSARAVKISTCVEEAEKCFGRMADSQEERQKRDEQIRETIIAKLVETGEKDRLKEMLRDRLVSCGWRDELKSFART